MPLISDDTATSFVDVAITNDDEENPIVTLARLQPPTQDKSRSYSTEHHYHNSTGSISIGSVSGTESNELSAKSSLSQRTPLCRYAGEASLNTLGASLNIFESEDDSLIDNGNSPSRVVVLEEELSKLKFELAEARSQGDWYRLEHRRLHAEYEDLQAFCQQLQTENAALQSGRIMPKLWLRSQANKRFAKPMPKKKYPKELSPQQPPSHRHSELRDVPISMLSNHDSREKKKRTGDEYLKQQLKYQSTQETGPFKQDQQPERQINTAHIVRNEQVQLLQQLQEREDGLGSIQERKLLGYPPPHDNELAGYFVVDDDDDDDVMPEELDAVSILSTDDDSVLRARMLSKERQRRRESAAPSIETVMEEEVEKPIMSPVLVVRHRQAPMSPSPFRGTRDDQQILEDDSDDSNPSRRGIDDISVLTETPSVFAENRGMMGRFMERVNLSPMRSSRIEDMPPPSRSRIPIQTVSATVGPSINGGMILQGPAYLANNRYAPRRRSSQSLDPTGSRRDSLVGELTDMNINEWRPDGSFYSEIEVSSVAKKPNVSSWWPKLKEPVQENVIAETDESSDLDSLDEMHIISRETSGRRQMPSHGSVRNIGMFGMNA